MGENGHLTGRHLIGGEWRQSAGEPVRAVDPATGEPLESGFFQAGEAEADRALSAAVSAFDETRNLVGERWADLLDDIAVTIEALGDPLLERAHRETALPMARLTSERGRMCSQLRMFAGMAREGSWVDAVIEHGEPGRQPLPKPDLRRMLRPIGPVVVFDASNFPFAFGACGGDTASALAAGNPVIVKAHPGHPGTDEMLAGAVLAALEAAGLPAGLFNLLQGAGPESGSALVRHPDTEAVGFTGSLRGGRALFDLAAARPRPIPVYAEMGSLNPLVILPAALSERGETLAEGLAGSITMGVGQFCTKPGVVFFIDGSDARKFVGALAERIAAMGPSTLLNAAIRSGFEKAVSRFPVVPGVCAHVEPSSSGYAGSTPGLYEVDARTWRERPELREEAFGPAALLVRCPDVEDLLDSLEMARGQLTGTVHTGDREDAGLVRRVAGELERGVGRLIFNGYPTGVEVCGAMIHGGPYPATTAAATTSVGTAAIFRFARPVAYQNVPDAMLPPALQESNPLGIRRTVDGQSIFERKPGKR